MHKDSLLWLQKQLHAQIEVNHSSRTDKDGFEHDQNRCPHCQCELRDKECDVCGYPEAYLLHTQKDKKAQLGTHQIASRQEIEMTMQNVHFEQEVDFPSFQNLESLAVSTLHR